MREAGDALVGRLLETLVAQVPGALGAGLTLGGEGGVRPVAAIGVAVELEAMQDAAGEGPTLLVLSTGRPLVLPGPEQAWSDPERWPAFARALAGSGAVTAGRVAGCVASGGDETGEQAVAVTLYLDRPARREDLERVDRLQPVLAGAVTVVEYCSGEEERAEQMVQMVQYRRVIEQAKGLVMATTGGDAGSAFATLARASQHFNVRLRNLAVALVELVGGAPAEGPTDPAAVVVPSERDRTAATRMWAALSSVPPSSGAPVDGA